MLAASLSEVRTQKSIELWVEMATLGQELCCKSQALFLRHHVVLLGPCDSDWRKSPWKSCKGGGNRKAEMGLWVWREITDGICNGKLGNVINGQSTDKIRKRLGVL